MKLELSVLPGRFAVCQQDAKAPMPRPEALGELWALVRTADELSLVVREELADPHWKVEAGWRCIGVTGKLEFELVGVLASLAQPLASAGISIFAISTYNTDYLLVREADLQRACDALNAAGHHVDGG